MMRLRGMINSQKLTTRKQQDKEDTCILHKNVYSENMPYTVGNDAQSRLNGGMKSRKRPLQNRSTLNDRDAASLLNYNNSINTPKRFKSPKPRQESSREKYTQEQYGSPGLIPIYRDVSSSSNNITGNLARENGDKLEDIPTSEMSNSTDTISSLFQTGRGINVRISAEKVERYSRAFEGESDGMDITAESHSQHRTLSINNGLLDTSTSVPIQHGHTTQSNRHDNDQIRSLFQTGSGRSVTISKAKLKSYEETFSKDHDTNVRQEGDVDTGRSDERVMTLFQSGRGKHVEISAKTLQNYQAKLNDEGDGEPHQSSGQGTSHDEVLVQVPAKATDKTTSLFQTGRGRSVEISTKTLQNYQEKFQNDQEASRQSEDESHRSLPDAHDAPLMVESLFTSGHGRKLQISAEKVAEYADRNREWMNECTEEDVEQSFNRRSISPRLTTKEEQSTVSRSNLVPSLFQTSRGDPVKISASKIQHYQALFASELSQDNCKEDLEDCLVLAKQTSVDDGTPRSIDNRAKTHTIGPAHLKQGDGSNPFQTGAGQSLDLSLTSVKACNEMNSAPGKGLPLGEAHPSIKNQSHGTNDVGITLPTPPPMVKVNVTRAYSVHPDATLVSNKSVLDSHDLGTRSSVTVKAIEKRIQRKDNRVFKPPRVKASSPRSHSMNTEKRNPVTKPPPQSCIHFPVHFIEQWKYEKLVSCPNAFDRNPFQSTVDVITAENGHLVHFDYLGRPVLESQEGYVGPFDLYQYMVSLKYIVPSNGASFKWFLNHFRWILLKCAAMERVFVSQLAGKYCTQAQVAYQLSQRYRRELETSQRPILRRVYQRDVHSGNAMVLFIAAVYDTHWVLSDGWYGIFAVPDAFLKRIGCKLVGTKIVVWNAALQNVAEGMDPLEARVNDHEELEQFSKFDSCSDAYMVVQTNSTRRVHWDTKLGAESSQFFLRSLPLSTLKQDGGLVRSIRCVILRTSDILYLQPKDAANGPRILNSKLIHQIFDDSVPESVPFLRLRVACTHALASNSNKHSHHGILTIWRPSEDLLPILHEGNEIYATSLAVTWKQQQLNLNSSKFSTFQPVGSNLHDAHAFVAYEGRSCLPITAISTMFGQEVDVCVYLVHVSNQYAFATDTSMKLVGVKLSKWNGKEWQAGTVVCIRNLFVSHYDKSLGILDCSILDMTTLIKSPSKGSYFHQPYNSLRVAVSMHHDSIQTLKKYITTSILNTNGKASSKTQEKTVLYGHPMYIYEFPQVMEDKTMGILYLDEGTRVMEVHLRQETLTHAKYLVDTNGWLSLVRVKATLRTNDQMTNSCRSWEALECSHQLTAETIDVIPSTMRINELLHQLQS